MLQNLTGWHALLVLAVVILIFGAAKLPALARSLGQSVRILRSEVGEAHGVGKEERAVPASDAVVQDHPNPGPPASASSFEK